MGESGTPIKSMVSGAKANDQGTNMTKQTNLNTRILKVEEVGDFWRKQTMPRIRLKGKWVAKAGILPNRYVKVASPQTGVLILHLMEKGE